MIKKHLFAALCVALSASSGVCSAFAENYYFRIRPSVSILNQNPFSVRINGDQAGVVGSRFAAKAEASSPRETLRFSISEGNLPPGISIDQTSGTIQGFPMARGRFAATVKAEDAFSTAMAPLSIVVYDPLEIASTISPYATVGKAYSAVFNAAGGDQTFKWAITGTPPTGLILGAVTQPTAILSGVPTTAGYWDGIRVTVADASSHTATGLPFAITVADPLLITGVPTLIGTVGEAYSTTFTSTGGHNPISWTMSPALPNDTGLRFSNGSISGIPSKATTISGVVVRATDNGATNSVASSPFSIAISAPLSVAGEPVSFATVGIGYNAVFTASGGAGGNIWNASPLPDGLSLANGSLTGTPTTTGTWNDIAISVKDRDGRMALYPSFSISVSSPLNLAGKPANLGTVGTAYSSPFTFSGGNGSYSWTVISGALPDGLTIQNGTIAGTPSKTGFWSNIVVRLKDGDGRTAQSESFSIDVHSPLLLTGSAPAIGTTGVGYSGAFSASGGDGSYTWKSVGGSLPPGLTMAGGTISGSPTQAGTWSNIIVQVEDGRGRVKQAPAFSVVISSPMWMTGGLSASGKVGTYYQAQLYANGGTGSYSWSVVYGSLPSGLSLSNGTVYGTPNVASTWSFTIRATDTNGRIADYGVFSISVAPNQVREPASGDYYDGWNYVWMDYGGSYTTLTWGGSYIGDFPANVTVISAGGATYYRGSFRESGGGGDWADSPFYNYAVYRTIP
jgi:hypothetical protein